LDLLEWIFRGKQKGASVCQVFVLPDGEVSGIDAALFP
jgi:hypothetical protein